MKPVDHEVVTMRCFEERTNAEAAEVVFRKIEQAFDSFGP